MLVIGEHRPFSEKEAKAIDNFCEKLISSYMLIMCRTIMVSMHVLLTLR